MEEEPLIDPLEINKDPKLIKDAQEEIGKLDVLVCGECHDVFHIIEQFQEHRSSGKCTGVSSVRDNYKHEPKPQVWAFMLWKNAQLRKKKEGEEMPTSWVIYQRWCKLDIHEKDAWITAGRNIQSFTKISAARMQEIKPTIQIPVMNRVGKPAGTISKKQDDEDPLEEGEIRLVQLSDAKKLAAIHQTTNKTTSEVDPLGDLDMRDSDSDLDTEEEAEKEVEMVEKDKVEKPKGAKRGPKPVRINADGTSANKVTGNRIALRTTKDGKTEEQAVDKILNKRYHPRRKAFEYMIKWQNEQFENSWEPVSHLEGGCKALLNEFEENLRKQKSTSRAKAVALQKQLDKNAANKSSSNITLTPGGRPQRTSKQKALNQVKVWCGDISEGDESLKRKFTSDDDSSDSFEKKFKMEDDTESSEDEKPAVTIRRIVKTNTINGVSKKESTENVLIPDKHGVVRVNQKQMPGLTSGVYIMSKTQGIIKLDSNSKDVAVAGGTSTVYKVAPKIGQTRIKVIKKEDGSTSDIIKVSPASKVVRSTPLKPILPKTSTPRIVQQRKNIPATIKKVSDVAIPKPVSKSKPKSDDESDGLEELEFPTDLPLPSPESPPGEFTLCPLTGKILGQKDEPVNSQIQEEPSQTSSLSVDKELDNLVKEATGEDMLNKTADTSSTFSLSQDSTTTSKDTSTENVEGGSKVATANENVNKPAVETVTSTTEKIRKPSETASSILSTALTNSNITETISPVISQKKLLSTPSTVRQKATGSHPVITRTIAPKLQQTTPTIITHVSGPHRATPRPKAIGDPVLNRTPNVNTYSNKNAKIPRKIGNTTIYKTTVPASSPIVQKIHPASADLHQSPTGGVINMPLLTDEPSTSTAGMDSSTTDTISVTSDNTLTDVSTLSLPETETPLLITGDDGTIYQVAGQNEDGQTILITQGPDGQQQCVLVATESLTTEENQVLSLDNIVSEGSEVNEPLMVNTESEAENSEDSQVVAQIVKADPPSPGGTRKVVLMLPDGNLMVTEVTAEQFAALDLDK